MNANPNLWNGRDEDRPLIETEEVVFGTTRVCRHVMRDPKTKEIIAVIYGNEPLS